MGLKYRDNKARYFHMRLLEFISIIEARRNADHPSQQADRVPGKGRVGLNDLLKKYVNNPNIYVSFTALPKAGINPASAFETPLGIYCYPIKAYYSDVEGADLSQSVPFAGNQPFIMVLEATKPLMDVSSYSQEDLKRDMDVMRGWLPEGKLDQIYDNIFYNRMPSDKVPGDAPIALFWKITRQLANTGNAGSTGKMATVRWNGILRKLGYTGFSDKHGLGVIHINEPIQAFFLNTSGFRVVEKLDRKHINAAGHYYNKMKQDPQLNNQGAHFLAKFKKAMGDPEKQLAMLADNQAFLYKSPLPMNLDIWKLAIDKFGDGFFRGLNKASLPNAAQQVEMIKSGEFGDALLKLPATRLVPDVIPYAPEDKLIYYVNGIESTQRLISEDIWKHLMAPGRSKALMRLIEKAGGQSIPYGILDEMVSGNPDMMEHILAYSHYNTTKQVAPSERYAFEKIPKEFTTHFLASEPHRQKELENQIILPFVEKHGWDALADHDVGLFLNFATMSMQDVPQETMVYAVDSLKNEEARMKAIKRLLSNVRFMGHGPFEKYVIDNHMDKIEEFGDELSDDGHLYAFKTYPEEYEENLPDYMWPEVVNDIA